MRIYDTRAVALDAVAARAGRPATSLAHDSPDARVVLFRLEPGEAVPVHSSTSTVLLVVVSGRGIVTGADGDRRVGAGDLVAYDVQEPHGMRAETEQLVIAAVIAPRPAAR
jgi:quercetin dioxygenase-like cupin family protein